MSKPPDDVVAKITNRHRAMMMDEVIGHTPREICAKYSITESRFSLLKRSPLWVQEIKTMRDELFQDQRNRLKQIQPKAITAYDELVEQFRPITAPGTDETVYAPNSPEIRLRAANAISDRNGMVSEGVIGSGGVIRVVLDEG